MKDQQILDILSKKNNAVHFKWTALRRLVLFY